MTSATGGPLLPHMTCLATGVPYPLARAAAVPFGSVTGQPRFCLGAAT